jgi:hypothetical protein
MTVDGCFFRHCEAGLPAEAIQPAAAETFEPVSLDSLRKQSTLHGRVIRRRDDMAISPGQAAAALQEIERTERRTRASGGYAAASPHLVVWGLIWACGYVACDFVPPEQWGLVWLPLALLGSAGSAWLASRGRRGAAGGRAPGDGARSIGAAAAIAIFIMAFFWIVRPTDLRVGLVFPTMTMGLVYCLAGLYARLPRFVWIGAGAFTVTIAGYLIVPEWTAFWVAAAGGGGLILGGLWLRKV